MPIVHTVMSDAHRCDIAKPLPNNVFLKIMNLNYKLVYSVIMPI